MEWLWNNFDIVSQKAPLDFKLAKATQFPTRTDLDIGSLKMSIPAKAFLLSQMAVASGDKTTPNLAAFSDQTLQNMIKVLMKRDYTEESYFASLENYPMAKSETLELPIEQLVKEPWVRFVRDDDDLLTRSGLIQYLVNIYGDHGTDDEIVNHLIHGVFYGTNWLLLSKEDLIKFHTGWNLDFPLDLTHVGIITLQNAIIGELLVSAFYDSEITIGYFRDLYSNEFDIMSHWEGRDRKSVV